MTTAPEQVTNASSVDVRLVASCPGCKNIHPLEACLDCFKPLCAECMKIHFEEWQRSTSKYSKSIEQKVDKYLEKINSLNPLIKENEAKIAQAKLEIENNFQILVEKLNNEKNEIFKMLDQIHSDNQQYKKFEKNIIELKVDIRALEQVNQISSDDPKHTLEISKFKQFREKIHKMSSIFAEIKNKPFKIIGDYEKPKPLESSFFGNLIINESESVLKSQKSELSKQNSEKSNKEVKETKVHMFGTLRVKLRQIAEQFGDFNQIARSPLAEFDTQVQPNFVTSYKSIIFIVDVNGNLAVVEFNGESKLKVELKLGILNVRGIGANQTYLAVTFSDLSKENIKAIGNKKLKINAGIALFKWTDSFKFDKIIDLPNGKFISPGSLVLNETHLFVTDRELNAILKFEIKSGNLQDRSVIKNSHPTGISFLNNNHLVYADSFKQEINLIEIDNLSKSLKTIRINDELQSLNGPYDLVTKKNTCLFAKSRSDSRIIVFDLDLNFKNAFEHEFSNYLGLTMVNSGEQSECLVIGKTNNTSKLFKLSYFREF